MKQLENFQRTNGQWAMLQKNVLPCSPCPFLDQSGWWWNAEEFAAHTGAVFCSCWKHLSPTPHFFAYNYALFKPLKLEYGIWELECLFTKGCNSEIIGHLGSWISLCLDDLKFPKTKTSLKVIEFKNYERLTLKVHVYSYRSPAQRTGLTYFYF